MKKITLNPLLLLIFLGSVNLCQAQVNTDYNVGFSRKSLDPDQRQLSLALAGYGLPAEGRFSLSWDRIDGTDTETEVGKIFEAKKQPLYLNKAKMILHQDGKLYLHQNKKQELISGEHNFRLVQAYSDLLIGQDGQQQLWCAVFNKDQVFWQKIEQLEETVAFTILGNNLIVVDGQERMWRVSLINNPAFEKVQIGRFNGVTHNIHIDALQTIDSQLYALDDQGHVYRAIHSSDHSLETSAFVVQQGKDKLLVLTLDLCGVNFSFTHDVKEKIAKKLKLPVNAILINASHTHFAPVSQAWTTWADYYQKPDSNYLNQVIAPAMISAATEANKNLKPGFIYFGRGETFIGTNRNKERNGQGPVDRALDVIRVTDRSNQLIGVVFLTGCHPVFKNKGTEAFTISANFPGVARQYIKEELGPVHTLFIQGCAGDINPITDDFRETGTSLGKDVLQVLGSSMEPVQGALTSYLDSVLIPVKPMSREELDAFRKQNMELKQQTVQSEKNIRWVKLMDTRYDKQQLRNVLPVYYQTLNLGSWKLFGLSREAVTSYGMKIRELWPDQHVSVAGYCNDVASYLPDAWHIKHKVYEGYESFFWYGQEGIPPINVQEIILEDIKMKNR